MENNIVKRINSITSIPEPVVEITEYLLSDEISTIDKLYLVAKLKVSAKYIEEALKYPDVKSVINEISELELQDGKSEIITDFGYTLTYAPTYTKYTYDECGHTGLDFISAISDIFKEYIKRESNMLKTIPQGKTKEIVIDTDELMNILKTVVDTAQEVIDSLDGMNRVVKVNAPIKKQTKSLKLKRNG